MGDWAGDVSVGRFPAYFLKCFLQPFFFYTSDRKYSKKPSKKKFSKIFYKNFFEFLSEIVLQTFIGGRETITRLSIFRDIPEKHDSSKKIVQFFFHIFFLVFEKSKV